MYCTCDLNKCWNIIPTREAIIGFQYQLVSTDTISSTQSNTTYPSAILVVLKKKGPPGSSYLEVYSCYIRDIHVMGRWADIFILFCSKEINSNKVNLGAKMECVQTSLCNVSMGVTCKTVKHQAELQMCLKPCIPKDVQGGFFFFPFLPWHVHACQSLR